LHSPNNIAPTKMHALDNLEEVSS